MLRLFGLTLWTAVLLAALGGCHLLFPFEHQAPSDDTGLARDGGAQDLRQDRAPGETPLFDVSPADAPPTDAPTSLPDGAADAPLPTKIGSPLKSSQKMTCDTADTAGGLAPAGVCTIVATMTYTSTGALRPRHFQVVTLTNNNLVLNADGGPAGAGAIVSVPAAALGADGKLTPGEAFKQTFKIGLKTKTPYSFYIDVFGDVLP